MTAVADAWDRASAAVALSGVLDGRLDGDDELGPGAIMVVDLDLRAAERFAPGGASGGGPAAPSAGWAPWAGARRRPGHPPMAPVAPPPGLGRIVVGVSDWGGRAGAEECDVALTADPAARAPWVVTADLPATVAALRGAVAANPAAAVTAAALLRRGGAGPPDDDLWCESVAYATLQGGGEFADWLARRPARAAGRAQRSPPVRVERSGDGMTITLARPEVRNAYSAAMRDHLVHALQLVAVDPTITGVVLRAEGPSFCSGGDLDEFGTTADTSAAHLLRMRRNAGWWLYRSADRITARLHGACVGAGIELPAFAGTVVAAPGTTVRLPEVSMGLVPGAGGTASIPRRIGRHRTAYLAISGATIDAAQALAWGLVDAVGDHPGP